MDITKSLKFDKSGLIPVIVQDYENAKVLMFAFMNEEALRLSIKSKQATYYSRSGRKLWHKGEQSGYTQNIKNILTDCDKDVLLLQVEQTGGISCHTGRKSCFFNQLKGNDWEIISPVIKDPMEIYK